MQPHSIARARVKHARARLTTITKYNKMIKITIFKYINISICHKNVAAGFVPPHMRAQPRLFCKLYFTKNTFFTFSLKKIWSYQKKAVPLHRQNKNNIY